MIIFVVILVFSWLHCLWCCQVELHSYGMDDLDADQKYCSVHLNGKQILKYGVNYVTDGIIGGLFVGALDPAKCSMSVNFRRYDTYSGMFQMGKFYTETKLLLDQNPDAFLIAVTGDAIFPSSWPAGHPFQIGLENFLGIPATQIGGSGGVGNKLSFAVASHLRDYKGQGLGPSILQVDVRDEPTRSCDIDETKVTYNNNILETIEAKSLLDCTLECVIRDNCNRYSVNNAKDVLCVLYGDPNNHAPRDLNDGGRVREIIPVCYSKPYQGT